MRRALFIVHEADAPPGYIGEAAQARGFAVDRADVWKRDLRQRGSASEPAGGDFRERASASEPAAGHFPDPAAHDLIVPLGSAESAYDDDVPWLAHELDFLRRTARAGTAVFGICFGAQVLARALGGSVRPAARPEVGWFMIDSDADGDIAPGPWLEWHFDTITPPTGAQTLARSPGGVQAYQHGRHLGVQFHPEVSPDILAAWIANSSQQLDQLGVDADAFQRETRRRARQARSAAYHLFDRVMARLGLT